jgi:glycosyltransferase involved in cell wall biosynthesis
MSSLAVRSILSQTFQALELIVIDDGSSDSTPSILSALAATDGRIRLLSSGGRGIVEALNLGIGHSRSDLIARMDADDIAMPERLERQIQFMRSNTGVVASGSSRCF